MLEEIEEFLRRAAEKRNDALQGPAAHPNRPQRPVDVEIVNPHIPDVEVIEPEIVEADVYTQGVADHVAHHLDTSSYEARDARLGRQVGRADEKLEARLHHKFDHQLGALDTDGAKMASDEPDYAVPVTPSEIAQLLGSPENIRNAIILNEILRPPEQDW